MEKNNFFFTKPDPEYLKLLVEENIPENLAEVPRELTSEELEALRNKIDMDMPSHDIAVDRELTPSEIAYFRKSYQVQIENVLPELEQEYEEVKAEYKRRLKELEERILAAKTIVKDSVRTIKQGTEPYTIPAEKILRFVFRDNWLYYAKIDEDTSLKLVHIRPLMDSDRKELQEMLFRRDASDILLEITKNKSNANFWSSEPVPEEIAK